MFKKRRSRWFQGLLWAEEQVRIQGIEPFKINYMAVVYDFSDFDRGILDYLAHHKVIEETKKMTKPGMAPVWRVRFKKADGYMTFVEYGEANGPDIPKIRVIKQAKTDIQNDPDLVEIDEIYPVDGGVVNHT